MEHGNAFGNAFPLPPAPHRGFLCGCFPQGFLGSTILVFPDQALSRLLALPLLYSAAPGLAAVFSSLVQKVTSVM